MSKPHLQRPPIFTLDHACHFYLWTMLLHFGFQMHSLPQWPKWVSNICLKGHKAGCSGPWRRSYTVYTPEWLPHASVSLPDWNQKYRKGLPWWPSGWESACQWRGHRFDPWLGKTLHATGQLSPRAGTTEGRAPESLRSSVREAATPRSPSTAHSSEDPAQPQIKK